MAGPLSFILAYTMMIATAELQFSVLEQRLFLKGTVFAKIVSDLSSASRGVAESIFDRVALPRGRKPDR